MANSNRKKSRKLQNAKKAKAAEEKPIKYTVTAEQTG